jgi:hypothetical protein
MSAPITGPYSWNVRRIPPYWPGYPGTNTAYGDLEINRSSYRQRRPYNLPLPYTYHKCVVVKYSNLPQHQATNGYFWTAPPSFTDSYLSQERSWAKNGALARFNGKVKETASWLVTLAEHKQAMQMIENRLFTLASVTKSLLRGRVDLAAEELGVFGTKDYRTKRRLGKIKGNAKAASNNMLEFAFGWQPVVSDIQSSMKILQAEIPRKPVKATCRISVDKINGSWPGSTGSHVTGYLQCTIGAFVSISNPNLYLANQLGLLNPAIVAYELVPWSFVLGWFVNVEQFLSSFTEYAGINVVDPYYTEGSNCISNWIWKWGFNIPDSVGSEQRWYIVRTVGSLPSVDLVVKKPWTLSAMRGATAAALIVQNLSEMDHQRRTPDGRRKSWVW